MLISSLPLRAHYLWEPRWHALLAPLNADIPMSKTSEIARSMCGLSEHEQREMVAGRRSIPTIAWRLLEALEAVRVSAGPQSDLPLDAGAMIALGARRGLEDTVVVAVHYKSRELSVPRATVAPASESPARKE